jgi:hypothetical protein
MCFKERASVQLLQNTLPTSPSSCSSTGKRQPVLERKDADSHKNPPCILSKNQSIEPSLFLAIAAGRISKSPRTCMPNNLYKKAKAHKVFLGSEDDD